MNNRSIVGRDVMFQEYAHSCGRWLVCVAEVIAAGIGPHGEWSCLIARVDGGIEAVTPQCVTLCESLAQAEQLAKIEKKRKYLGRGHKRRVQ